MTTTAIKYVAAIVVAFFALYGAYRHGVTTERTKCELAAETIRADAAEAQRKALQDYADRTAKDIERARDDERARISDEAQRKADYDKITKQVDDYVQTRPGLRGCGLDADGLRIWNNANRGIADAAATADD